MARLWRVSLGPRMTTVGSPGSRWTSKKTSTEMMKATTTSWRNRRMKYLAMVVGTRSRWPVRLSVQPDLGREDDALVESVARGATGQGQPGEVLDPLVTDHREGVLLQPQIREIPSQELVEFLVGHLP